MSRHNQASASDPTRSLQAMQLEALLPQCIRISAQWVNAMAEPADITSVLSALSHILFASEISIAQYNLADGSSKKLHTTDRRSSSEPRFTSAFFAGASREMKIASGQTLRLQDFQSGSHGPRTAPIGQGDCFAILLSVSSLRIETLEISFNQRPQPEDRVIISAFATPFATAWTEASPSVPKAKQASPSDSIETPPILGPQNSYSLSRTELRVCKRVGQGKSPKSIADELGVTIATTRSHLKSIFAKTGTSGQRALQHRLHNPEVLGADL